MVTAPDITGFLYVYSALFVREFTGFYEPVWCFSTYLPHVKLWPSVFEIVFSARVFSCFMYVISRDVVNKLKTKLKKMFLIRAITTFRKWNQLFSVREITGFCEKIQKMEKTFSICVITNFHIWNQLLSVRELMGFSEKVQVKTRFNAAY